MLCAICSDAPVVAGVLCRDCQDDLPAGNLAPEQIVSSGTRGVAALIDPWGRPHGITSGATIGRSSEGTSVGILDAGISRRHAKFFFNKAQGAWLVEDEKSSNGTAVNENPISEPTVVRRGDRITFSGVGFYFIDDSRKLPEPSRLNADVPTAPQFKSESPFAGVKDENTDVGLPSIDVRLSEPTGGGGGFLEIAGHQVQLTMTQFEFVRFMVDRMAAEAHQPELVRGFVRTSELIAQLSWDSHDPGDNHVKQLVRRVRRAFIKVGIGDLIESRHRFGYRLRAIPNILSRQAGG